MEFAIWNYTFYAHDSPITVDPADTSLILTEAPMSLPAISANTDQIVFEEYGFESYYRCTPGSLVPWNNFEADLFASQAAAPQSSPQADKSSSPKTQQPPLAECALVVDMGFNATTVLPTILGEVYWPAVQQLNVGGRLLTNYLRETLSFRHYNMMEETYLVNAVKESVSFVSTDFYKDLARCKDYKEKRGAESAGVLSQLESLNLSPKAERSRYEDLGPYVVKYALPENPSEIGEILSDTPQNLPNQLASSISTPGADPSESRRQILRLSTERFSVPELLFSPHHIGLAQAGLSEAIMTSVSKAPAELRSLLLANVVVVGGCANLPGIVDRLYHDLQPQVTSYTSLANSTQRGGGILRIAKPTNVNPEAYPWYGGAKLGLQHDMLEKVYVTKADYMEYGERLCASKFNAKRGTDEEDINIQDLRRNRSVSLDDDDEDDDDL